MQMPDANVKKALDDLCGFDDSDEMKILSRGYIFSFKIFQFFICTYIKDYLQNFS